MSPENVGGKSLGDLSESPNPDCPVLCPITRMDCRQGCVQECVDGNLRTPAPKAREALPYDLDHETVIFVRDLLREAARDLRPTRTTLSRAYGAGLCSGKLDSAATAISDAVGCLAAYFDDEGAAAVLAPRKETR